MTLRNIGVPKVALGLHDGGMSDVVERRRAAFKAWVKENGGVADIARRAEIPATTLYSYLTGKSDSLKGTTQEAITDAYGVTTEMLFSNVGPRTVPLVGFVGAGAEAHYYEPADLGEVDAPDDATPKTVAAEIRGTSLGPLFDSWLIFYDDVRDPVTSDQIGQLCIVGLADGKVLVKRLRHAAGDRYHLESNAEPTMYDQEVMWAARVKGMTPR